MLCVAAGDFNSVLMAFFGLYNHVIMRHVRAQEGKELRKLQT